MQTVSDIPFEVMQLHLYLGLAFGLVTCIIDLLQLKQPLLYIASLTCRGKVNEACDDVYYFVKDRYFVNESVEAILRGKWYSSKVVRAVPPTAAELEQYKEEQDEELSKEDKLLLLNQYGPPPELLKYEVREDFGENDNHSSPIYTVN